MSELVDLPTLLLPEEYTDKELEEEARKIYFDDLAKNPPVLGSITGIKNLPLEVTATEGAFKKIFGETEKWSSYHHKKTGDLEKERLRRVNWIRPVLEMKVKGLQIYVNNHSMKPRQHGMDPDAEKKRAYVIKQSGLLYFVSLKYLEHSMVLTTAYEPEGKWLRDTLKKHGTSQLFPRP